jgi:hypothetical protein
LEISPTSTPRRPALDAVRLPAIFLIITAALSIVRGMIGLVTPGMSDERLARALEDPDAPEWLRDVAEISAGPAETGSHVLSIVIGGLILFGALKMMRLQSYGLAMAASILAVIPCLSPCCCLGIPFGIWSLVVLKKPEVKSAFASSGGPGI